MATFSTFIGSGRPLFDVDFRAVPVTSRLLDCKGDMALGTGCGACSLCVEQTALLASRNTPQLSNQSCRRSAFSELTPLQLSNQKEA